MSGNLTYAQLEGVWLQAAQGTQYATQTWAALMAAIAEAESGGDPNDTNPRDSNGKGGTQTSWGLWQISNGDHTVPSPNWNDPGVNASLALGKLQEQGLGAWGTYTSGAYKGYVSSSTTPDMTGIGAVDTSATTGSAASAAAQAEANCAWRINFNIPLLGGDVCLLSWSQIRAISAVTLLIGGGLLAVFAVSSLTGISVPGGAAGGALAGSVKGPSGAAIGAVKGAANSKASDELAQEAHTQRQYSRQRRARENYARDVERDVPPF